MLEGKWKLYKQAPLRYNTEVSQPFFALFYQTFNGFHYHFRLFAEVEGRLDASQ
jgi:hypothetical protein